MPNLRYSNQKWTLTVPLNYYQYIKLTQNIINNNIGHFSTIFIINTEIINIFCYQNLLKFIKIYQ